MVWWRTLIDKQKDSPQRQARAGAKERDESVWQCLEAGAIALEVLEPQHSDKGASAGAVSVAVHKYAATSADEVWRKAEAGQ